MKTHYSAYAKRINGQRFYFVKKFRVFPEYENVPPMLEGYGMHTDFTRACQIAMIWDAGLQQQLLNSIEVNNARVIPLHPEPRVIRLGKKHHPLLRLIGL